ncbi:MAG: hypothetical protein JNK72_26635 [Myxococcales bacterium]|nr:hypothetical protein [Myxococcales bacterium]
MQFSRWIVVASLVCASACTARGGSSGGGGGGGSDAGGGTDSGAIPGEDTPRPTNDNGPAVDTGLGSDAGPGSDTGPTADDVGSPEFDVPPAPRCGDGTCNAGETCKSCRADCESQCPVGPRCGDGTCNGGETCESCRADCAAQCPAPVDVPPAARCGDGTCNGSETCESCRADCAALCPPPVDVPPAARCGDGTCNGSETCESCASDCGTCAGGGFMTACGSTVTQGPNRNCGWTFGMTFTCLPNRATMVGCSGSAGVGSLCQPSYGVCTGDPVMRVCPGTAPCSAASALAVLSGNADDQCGTCPSAYVTCPSSGQIYVMTGDYDSNQPSQRGTCTPAVR